MDAFAQLMAFARETHALGQIAGRLGWDQETMMPRGAASQRSEESAAIESVLHARNCDPRVGAWLSDLPSGLDDEQRAQVRVIRRSFDRATKVPAKLASELARITSISQGEWAQARQDDDFGAFSGRLAEIVALKREEAAALAEDGNLYDALLQDYEPGARSADLEAMFGALRPRLVALRENILGSERAVPVLEGQFPEDIQLQLSQRLAETFGYDLNRGRIDKAVHPFSSGSGDDVRITTRTDESDPFNCLYSTIHEVGHACYEQNIDPRFGLTPIGRGASMGVHESQSRIYENQIGRGAPFTSWLFSQMSASFEAMNVRDADTFYAAVNRAEPGYIRTEADEVHYNLHVMLRFDLERALIDGSLAVEDLEEAWNTRFEADFGLPIHKASQGCLQDVHWAVGLFGYFPTYTLGNVYAGCLYKALQSELDVFEALSEGDTSAVTAWLKDRLQRFGSLRLGDDTIRHATGEAPSEGPLLDYLERKFSEIYRF